MVLKAIEECIRTAMRLDFSPLPGGKKNPYAPSIDQITPGLGYTPDNFQITQGWKNQAKGDWFSNRQLEIAIEEDAALTKQANSIRLGKMRAHSSASVEEMFE